MRKRILFIAPCLPYPPNSGGDIRLFNIIKHLGNDSRISLVCFGDAEKDGDRISKFQEQTGVDNVVLAPYPGLSRNIASRFWSKNPYGTNYSVSAALKDALVKTANSGKFDLAYIDHLYMCQYARFLRPMKVVVSLPDVDSVKFTDYVQRNTGTLQNRLVHELQLFFIKRIENSLSSISDAVVVVSENDRKIIENLTGQCKIFVVENGVDTDYFLPLPRNEETRKKRMLFMGTLFYPPNIEAAIFFVKQVLPTIKRERADAELLVAGKMPVEEVNNLSKYAGVRVAGDVQDMRVPLRDSDVIVIPILSGSGTRIKILEAMASARPVVSTRKGCEGLELENGKNILISQSDSPEEFARLVLSLFTDDILAERLIRNGLELARERDWRRISAKHARFLEEIL